MPRGDARLPSDARFSCQSCGRCCTMWSVTVSQAKRDELVTHDWGADPFERNPGPGDPFRTRMINGRCFFLDEANRCRIHSTLGYEAKTGWVQSLSVTFYNGQRNHVWAIELLLPDSK